MEITAAVAQWVRAFDPPAEGWMFESQPPQTLVAKTGNSSTAKHGIRCECHRSSEMTIINGCPVSQ